MRKSLIILSLFFLTVNCVYAKSFAEKEMEKRAKIEEDALARQAKIREEYQKDQEFQEKEALKEDLTEIGKINSYNEKQLREATENSEENIQQPEEERGWFGFKKKSAEDKEFEKEKKSEIEELREELKANEERALNFIFQSEELEEDLESAEKFFSKTEKEQLLELWRSTLARNRTIQFVIRSLSTDPDDLEKNNAVMQVLSRALFVPFYAISAVADNALIQGGSSVGARVIGDVVNANMDKKDQTKQITRTDLIVLFMLVDEVAERLRNSYYAYKESKIEKQLLDYEIKLATLDLDKAMELEEINQDHTAVFFTKTVIRDVERKLRQNKLNFKNANRKLIELAGEDAVNNVDLLIDLEIDESLGEILGV
jgi:hypothetical protein